jgi:glycerol-3-phosphate dehydrogenase (NAD(P)+)
MVPVMRVAVLGSGSWGTALTLLLARNLHEVTLLGRDIEEIEALRSHRENLRYLPGFVLPKEVRYMLLSQEAEPAEMLVLAVPSGACRQVLSAYSQPARIITVAAKGLELPSGKLISEVVSEVAPQSVVTILSGPNLAVEVARGIPTVALAASQDRDVARKVRDAFHSPTFRVSETDDVVGVELAGALKNVLAIGAGMSDGLGFGDNTKGAFLSRGLLEMNRLGEAMGGSMSTFLGPAGVGDLFATAASKLSRNYRVGRLISEGRTLQEALHEIGQVAEGVATSEAVQLLSRKHNVEMPVFTAVEAVLRGAMTPAKAVAALMERPNP